MEEKRKIKIGIFGIGRGAVFINYRNDPINFEIVALCDKDEPRMLTVKQRYGLGDSTKTYTDFDEFIKNPEIEAVLLHNYFHEHAPFAIKALKAGKHVMSDCAAIGTLGEGVALCEAVEQSGKVYMFGENHGFQKAGLEFKRLYDAGEIGEVMYAEGEYNHPTTGKAPTSYRLADGPFHWRGWLPSTYYCTHAMGPLMYVTGRKPVSVNARSICLEDYNAHTRDVGLISFRDSRCAANLVTMDNGAVFRIFGTGCPGHSNSYRYHGTHGAMEMVHGPGYFGPGEIRVWHEPHHCKPGIPCERKYYPEWPAYNAQAQRWIAHHQGGDFWMAYFFAEAIRSGAPVPYDVYDGCMMSAVGICGWKSALNGGNEVHIPDYRDKADRAKVKDDFEMPVLDENGKIKPGYTWIKNTIRDVTLEHQIEEAKRCYEFNKGYYLSNVK